jgi:hypothetical protein
MKLAQQLFKWFAARPAPRALAVEPAPLMLALEPRIVYEASVAALPVAHHGEASHHHLNHEAQRTQSSMVPGEGVTPGGNPSHAAGHRASEANHKMQLTGAAQSSSPPEKEVVFVDTNVTNYQELLNGLPANTKVVLLSPDSNGLEQIAQYLQQHPGVDAINLISHGAQGQVQVGNVLLDQGDLSQYRAVLGQIGAAMKPNGDFLIYGCDVAAGSDGAALVHQIAAFSSLNVAASTNLVGAPALGGGWTLNYEVGDVHTPVVLSSAAEQGYQYLLSETIEDFTNPAASGYDFGATASFSLDGITYTITKTGALADNTVTEDPNLQSLGDESGSDNALLFDEDGTGNISKIQISMTNGSAFSIQSIDIDMIANGAITFLANGQSTSVSIASNGEFATQTVELSSADSVFNDVTSITIAGGNLVPTIGHIVYGPPAGPIVTTSGGASTFTSGDSSTQTPITVDSGITVSDSQASTLASATVQISGNFHSGQDVLAFTNTSSTTFGNINASYNATTGELTMTSSGATATTAQWQSALEAVTFDDTAADPNTSARTITFIVNDGVASSTAQTKTVDVDSPPIVTTTNGTTTYVGGASATAIDSGVSVTDPSQAAQASGTVSITTGFHSGDTLAFTNTSSTLFGNVAGSYNSTTGVLTLSSSGHTATDAQWSNALEAVTFSSGSTTYGDRTISFVINDGTDNSVAATKTVDVTNPDPVITADSGSAAFVAGDNTSSTPVAVDAGLTLTDPGSSTITQAQIQITGNFQSGLDALAFTNTSSTLFGNIVESAFNSSTGVMTLLSSGNTATLAQWQHALAAVTFTDTAITPSNATRTISFTVNDGAETSEVATRAVTVQDTDQTPIITIPGGALAYTGRGTPTPISVASGVDVSDRGDSTLVSATIAITGGYHRGEDWLAFHPDGATMGDITASFNPATGVMTLRSLSGAATLAQWEAALAAVTYTDTATSAASGVRTLSLTVNDGRQDSVAATREVDVNAGFLGGVSAPVTSAPGPAVLTVTIDDGAVLPAPVAIVLSELDTPATSAAAAVLTATFSSDAPHGEVSQPVLGTTSVAASNWASFEPIPVPFEVPITVDRQDVVAGLAFSLPLATVTSALGEGVAQTTENITVTLADGRPLPAWLHYDAATGELKGTAPTHGPHELHLALTLRDSTGHAMRSEVVLDVGPPSVAGQGAHRIVPHAPRAAPHAQRPAAKPSLAEQFVRQQRAFHVARRGAA